MSALIPHIALVSDTPAVTLAQVSAVSAALQKQAARDFGPLWDIDATIDAFDKLESVPVDYWPVILRDDIDEPGAAGYHTDDQGQPFSLVQADASLASYGQPRGFGNAAESAFASGTKADRKSKEVTQADRKPEKGPTKRR